MKLSFKTYFFFLKYDFFFSKALKQQKSVFVILYHLNITYLSGKLFAFSESIIGKTDLDDIMLKSLLLERVKFIELLFVNGFMMRNFLTVEKLKTLYNETVKCYTSLVIWKLIK